MKDKKLRIGLIGCGNMGNYYAYNISQEDGAEIIICCDPSSEKLEKFRLKWSIKSGTTDWKYLLQQDLDGVINCSFDSLHFDVFKKCFAGSIPMLMEKPPAVPLSVFNELYSAENYKKTGDWKFGINFSKRSLPAVAAAAQIIGSGRVGRVQRIELHYRQGWLVNHDFGDWHESSSWFWRLTGQYSHYGVLGDLGSHLLDLAILFGGRPTSINCSMTVFSKTPGELRGCKLNSADDAACSIGFENGAAGLVSVTRAAAGEKDEVSILVSGTEGSVKILPEQLKTGGRLFDVRTGEWEDVESSIKPMRNHQYFLELLENGECKGPGLDDAVINQVLLGAAVESSENRRLIDIEEFIEKYPDLKRYWTELWMNKKK